MQYYIRIFFLEPSYTLGGAQIKADRWGKTAEYITL